MKVATPDRHANNFDFLRLMAATMVIVHHTTTFHILPSVFSYEPVLDVNFGFIGVATFFIVSGYLIMMSWDRNPDLLRFLWARFLRIFPGLIVAVLLTIGVVGPLLTSLPLREYFSSAQTARYLATVDLIHLDLSLPGVVFDYGYPVSLNTPLWTLPVEFKMYLFLAILGIAGALRQRKLVLGVFALGLLGAVRPGGLLFSFLAYWGITSFVGGLLGVTNNYPLFFLAGSLLYQFREHVRFNKLLMTAVVILWIASHYTTYCVTISLFCLPYIVLCLANAGTRFLNQVGRIGDLSYGLYIYAFPIQHVWMKHAGLTNDGARLFFLVFLTTVPVAYASWHLIERRAMNLKDLFGNKRMQPSA
jgi:peptidoglycan/LPS O-acetylase OafA/YrhL